jgi:RNA recognition motif-containing protein
LQLASELRHRSSQLILLSRIDGDALRAAKNISAGRLDSSRAGLFQTLKRSLRASEPGPSNGNRFAEANPIRSFFLLPQGKGISMSTKLYVGNLAFQTTNQQLEDLFAQAGTVQSANVIEDRETGRSRGFAFVEMSTNAEAAAAIEQFNGKELAGRALKINEAKPRETRNGSSDRNSSRNRGGFSGGGNSGGGYREPRW